MLPGDENPANNSRHFNVNCFGDYTDKYRWTSINSCDGLLDDHVWASLEDAQGNMWFSGFYGASKFDGTNWTTYNSEDGMADDYAWAMAEDSQGNIWFATTSGGITQYDGTDFTVHQSETGVFEECVFEDSQGNMWFGSYESDGVLKFDGTDWTHYTHDDGLLGNVILSISEDMNGNMLFSSFDGVSLFNGTNWTELPMDGRSSLHISEIFKDSQDNVWFTESNGDFYKLNGAEWTIYTTDDGIINNRCEDIAEDSYGNLWFGGGSEINKFDGTDWHMLTPEDGLIECDWGIFSLTVDNQDNIWFGTGRCGVSKYVSVPTVQHFALAWTGNGVDHMNFYALSATLDGSDLQPGDEIAVFDGEYCVGAGVITEVLGGGVFLDFVASRNDAVQPDVNGYTPGNEVLFRIWDASEANEIDNLIVDYVSGEGIYSIGGTVSFNLTASSEIDQSIDLTSGWNIMSFNVEPQDMGMDLILQSLINGGVLVKVQDETGQAIEDVPPIGWIYNIGDMSPTEGYKIKVNDNTQLLTTGYAVDLPFSISLNEGWNIMGYPSPQGQDAQQMLSSLISDGSLLKVQDEQGQAIENVPPIGWIYNIQSFEPGEGYKIKVGMNTNLLVTAGTKKSAFIRDYDPAPTHFIPSWEGNGLDHMNIYLISPTIGGQRLNPGDEIGIYDGPLCVGYGIVTGPDQKYLSLVATKDDPTTDKTDGFTVGNPISIVLWIAGADVERTVGEMTVTPGYSTTFEKLGTTVLHPDFEPYVLSYLGDAYPNPFRDQTTITYGLSSDTHVKIEIYNVIGEKIALLVNEDLARGIYQVTWNNSDRSGIHFSPGIYFYKMVTRDYSDIKRVIFIK